MSIAGKTAKSGAEETLHSKAAGLCPVPFLEPGGLAEEAVAFRAATERRVLWFLKRMLAATYSLTGIGIGAGCDH